MASARPLCILFFWSVPSLANPSLLSTISVDANGQLPEVQSEAELLLELQRNVDDHDVESAQSCQGFFCGPPLPIELPSFSNYSMGPVGASERRACDVRFLRGVGCRMPGEWVDWCL